MANLTKLKKQYPLRFFPEDFERIKAKCVIDGVTFQKLGEILFKAYIRGDKHLAELVQKHSDSKKSQKKRRYNNLTDIEAEDIMSLLEKESPLKDISKIKEEAEEELKNEED